MHNLICNMNTHFNNMYVPDAVRTEGLPADTTVTSPFTNAHRVVLVKSISSIGSEMCIIYAGGALNDTTATA